MTRLITRCGLEEAADLLGYPHYSAEAAVVRTGHALGEDRRTDWFHDTIADLANALDSPNPVNFGHRRRYFTADWTIPDEDRHASSRRYSPHDWLAPTPRGPFGVPPTTPGHGAWSPAAIPPSRRWSKPSPTTVETAPAAP